MRMAGYLGARMVAAMRPAAEGEQEFRTVLMTPEAAKALLERNYDKNRRIREGYVRQLAAAMRGGRYESQNGQTVVIGAEDGVLYDGQHRLTAIVESGVSVPLAVALVRRGKDKFGTLDNGTKRRAADALDVPDKNECSSIGKIMACIEWGEAPLLSCLLGKMATGTMIDRALIVEYVNSHKDELLEAARIAGRAYMAVNKTITKTTFGVFYMLARYCGRDLMLDSFFDDLLDDAPSNRTVAAMKMQAMKAVLTNRGRPDSKWQLGLLLNAYEHFVALDSVTMLNKQAKYLEDYGKMVEKARARARAEQ